MSSRNIELRKVQHVAVLARVGSFVGAAKELHLTQSALTRSIQAIEREFAVQLFDRDRSGVTLTAVGREFLRRSQPLLTEADDLGRYLRRIGRGESGDVAFGFTILPAKLFLADLTEHLFVTKPHVRMSVAVREPNELLDLLIANRIEFFLASFIPNRPMAEVEVVELARFSMALAVRVGHPLLEKESIRSEDLAPYPILRSLFEWSESTPDDFATAHPATLRSDDYGALLQVTLNSDAIWVTSMPAASSDWNPNLARLPYASSLERQILTLKAVKLARRTLSPLASDILNDLRQRCAAVDMRDR
jgi:DNA-binding transcriptional LysR family regulator